MPSLMLISCTSIIGTKTTDVSCLTLSYISFSCDLDTYYESDRQDCGDGKDSAETVREIERHNAKMRELCD